MPAPSLLEASFAGPYRAWKATPGPEAADVLLKAVAPVLASAVRTYAGDAASPTVRSHAKRLALDAFDGYDPERAKLQTHLMVRLQPLRRLSAAAAHPIALPERAALDMQRLRTAETDFRDRLGRDPSSAEIADATGLSVRRLGKLRAFRPAVTEGATEAAAMAAEGGGAASVAVRGRPDDVWTEFVHGDLSPTDQLIMEHSLGLFGRPVVSKQAIAARLGISPGAVSQRAARIQAKLDSRGTIGAGLL